MATINLNQGKLKSGKAITENGTEYYEFLGVPYAKPPVGNLRFRNPQAPEPWDGERDATAVSENNVCYQVNFLDTNTTLGSEDCLYLNVFTPHLPAESNKLLPVMVYIHGGGFLFGNGIIKQESGPDFLIDNNVVVVTINYRVGVLGFLSLGIPEASGNMGLKDQIFALKWVQANIEKFSGDRGNVTVFGVSAGSASVEYLVLSPLSKGLFHKAILQSGSTLNQWAINKEPEKLLLKLLEYMGYTGSVENTREIHEYLLTSPASLLLTASFKIFESYAPNKLFFAFVPIVEKDLGDGEAFLTENPYKLLKEGRFNKVPVIMGMCRKEGYVMNIVKPKLIADLTSSKDFVQYYCNSIDEKDKKYFNTRFLNAYAESSSDDNDKDEFAVEFFGDVGLSLGILMSGREMARNGVTVYFYEFRYDGNINGYKRLFGGVGKGAAHGDDLVYIFKYREDSKICFGKDEEIRNSLVRMWTNFAKTGVPTSDLPIKWPVYTIESPVNLVIDNEFSLKSNYKSKKRELFEEFYEKYRDLL